MVKAPIVDFEVVRRGPQDWRVSVNGTDELPSFTNRDTCAAAARVRARRHHQDLGVSTRVRVPRSDGAVETAIWYPAPKGFLDTFVGSDASQELRWACEQYGRMRR